MRPHSPATVVLSLVALLAVATLPLTVHAVNRGAMRDPTVVATVRLPEVVPQLAQFTEAQARVQRLGDDITVEQKRLQDEIAALQTAAQREGLSISQQTAAREAYALAFLEYQAWFQFEIEKLDIEKSLLFREVDRAIRRALEDLCPISGYDLVIVDDGDIEIAVNPDLKSVPREKQVSDQMKARRVLYAAESVDITEELILRMNNQFNAGP